MACIIDTGNHYVAQVKRNQPSLFDEIGRCILERVPLDMYEAHEKGHGHHGMGGTQVGIVVCTMP